MRPVPVAIEPLLAPHGYRPRQRHALVHLTTDSRDVVPGTLFVACRGERHDGHRYIDEAVARGATLVIHETGWSWTAPDGVEALPVPDPRGLATDLAAPFYDYPTRGVPVFGVTGTNGKSTTASLLERLLTLQGSQPASISTFGIRNGANLRQLENVVPEPVLLQRALRGLIDAGADALVLEISSQALAAGRARGLELDAAVLTNVTPEHLDAHGTMERYLDAKLELFRTLARSPKPRPRAVLWRDGWCARRIVEALSELGLSATTFAVGQSPAGVPPADLVATGLRMGPQGVDCHVHWRDAPPFALQSPWLGEFNLRNVLGTLALLPSVTEQLARAEAAAQDLLATALRGLQVPGRLEPIENSLGARIFVDYAHTEDGLAQVLSALGALPHRRLIVVFGCGGDRDRSKRPRMGEVAGRSADHVIITSDNPRTEAPEQIAAEIRVGLPEGCSHELELDREQAIALAVSRLGEGDVLVVAGKGHEAVQVLGDVRIPFRDQEVLRKVLSAPARPPRPPM
jgi:UDP-N-acetylmuramoyl-L-alanyl-D-glutamate--2,6-diaminopimelate ligase